MSKLIIRCAFLIVWIVHLDGEVYQDRPKIKTADGDLILEPAFDKNIYLLPNGPKSSIFVGDKNILEAKINRQDINEVLNNNNEDILNGPNGILKRLEALELSKVSQLPNDVYLNISTLWRKVNNLHRKVINLQVQIFNRARDDCQSHPCKHGGTCLNLVDGYHCLCPSNWEGQDCDEDVNECRNFAGTDLGCQNGATCINKPGTYECLCKPKWFGIHCTRKEKDCTGGDFEMCGHGKCIPVSSGDGITCICDQGWTTNGTSVSCLTDVNECESQSGPRCSVNPKVECINLPGSFRCGQCPPGYEGDGYTCSDIDECIVIPNGGCSPLVSCHNTIGSRICGSCPPGYVGDGVTCNWRGSCNINHGGCHPSAQCVENMVPGGQATQCICPDGMSGDGMGLTGCYIPMHNNLTVNCDSNPCGTHGQCHVVRSGYTCICQRGYGGANCEVPANPCAVNPCHNNGICRQDDSLSRGFRCECTFQYSGPLCQISSRTCGGVLDNEEGSIVYPMSNTTYSHNSRCAWVIHTIPGKVINVTFTKFNLEESPECSYDFLQIHDGHNSASQLIGRFCGNSYPNGGNIISSNNYLYFWFRSDSTVSKYGFALHWTSVQPVCGGEVNATTHGHISSPGSPGKYPPNRDCYWHLKATLGKRIQLHFFALDLESHANCSFDYLAIYDGMRSTDPLLNKFCNTTQPAPMQSAGSELLIHFHSDAYGSGYGFQLAYAPIEGVPGCGGYFTSDKGEIISPSFNGTYLTNLLCEYKIKTSIGTKIRIDFKQFSLERSFKCRFDYLKIYDGSSSDAPLVGKFCGSTHPKYYISTSNTLFIKFKSDLTVSTEGFKISYQSLCQTTLLGDSGVIKSPGYPFSYPSNKACEYVIATTPGKAITLTFQDFDVEDNRRYQCQFDYVEVRDGADSNSTSIGKFCGSSIPPTITSTHNYMYIKFKSDMSISGTGFYANYTTIDTECGGIYRKTTGLINLPSDDTTTYNNDQKCTWLLIPPDGMNIKLTWNRFEIENTPSCSSDYLEIIELEDNDVQNSIGRFCGTKSPPALTIATSRLMIKFQSDSSVRSSGFSLSYTYLDEKTHCGGTFLKSHGFIYSPGWPNRYEINRDCKWTIMVPAGQQIRVNISKFDLERPARDSCTHGDYLEFRNGASPSSPLIGQYCGRFESKLITSFGNTLYIHFHSDFYLTGNGFKLEWDGSIMGCGGTLSGSTGAISSPNYPENYNEDSECFYKIVTSLGSRIRLSFTDLELERTNNCKDDYIQIFDGRDTYAPSLGKHCYMSTDLNNIESSTNYLFIKFRTDFYNEKKGFLLNYFTVCNNNLTGRYGVIESPDYPNNYPLHSNCIWTINVPKGNKINVTFSHFDIFQHNSYRFWWRNQRRKDCELDYLQWKESTESAFSTKLCGNTLPPMITTRGNSLQIKFASGGYGSKSGFRLEWISYGCGGHIQRSFGSISIDPRLTSDEIECEWLVESPVGTIVSLAVMDLYLLNSVNCTTDAIEAYNGQDTNSPLISKICHKQPTLIQSTANFMLVRFIKQSNLKGAYFRSTFSAPKSSCGGSIQAPSGYIYSKNYPKNYEDNFDCVWVISVPRYHRIHLTFEDLDLYAFSDLEKEANCGDSIKIFDNRYLMNSNYTTRICGYTKITELTTNNNRIIMQFTTDNFGNAKGFKIKFETVCGYEVNATYDGIITNENFAPYTNESCTWTIVAPRLDQKISLTITHLDLPKHNTEIRSNRSCSLSYLRLYDGNNINSPLIDEYCGHKAPPLIISHGSFMTIMFGSYTNETAGHFSAHYSILSTACGGTLTSEAGSIVSPYYPREYPVNSDCEWILSTSPGNLVALTFEQFELEDSDGCNDDYLEIRENSGSGTLLGVYCGSNIPTNTTSAEKLYIKFHSNDKNSGKGFLLHYEFLHGKEITGLERGEIASPLYPHIYRGIGEYSWRIFVNGIGPIILTIDALEIRSYTEICLNKLSVYDGYDETAPLIDEICGTLTEGPKVLQTSSNLVYIKLTMHETNSGALFHLRWSKSDKLTETNEEDKINCGSNTTVLIPPGNVSILESPNYPNTYADNLNCEWVFQAYGGRHLTLRFQDIDIEEANRCFSDYISVYSATVPGQWKPVVEHLCESNSITQNINSSTYMKVNFKTDYSIGRKGFRGQVSSLCGGIVTELSGEIGPTWQDANTIFHVYNRMSCEWVVKVRPGRVIELDFIHFNISNTDDHCSIDVTLRNGDSTDSPLLSSGKYCGYDHEVKNNIVTSSNALHISFSINRYIPKFQNFKIHYEEKGVECGATSKLELGHNWEIITSPNFPSPPTSFSECIWVFTGPPGEILQIDFLDRFDLDDVSDCGNEVVEIRDGSSSFAPLKGKYCGEKPGTIKTTSNTVFIRYLTQLSVPRNGFKANVSISVCGGTIIADSGEIKSPGYPHNHLMPVPSVCEWHIRGKPASVLNIYPKDIDIPESESPCATKITIERTLPGNDSVTILRTFCRSQEDHDMSPIETFTNEITIKYHVSKPSEWYRGLEIRGFRFSFNSSRYMCGSHIKTSEGYITTPGYPLETSLRFCQWFIEVPDKSRKIHLEILDNDPEKQNIIISNEIALISRIQPINFNSPQTLRSFDSSGPKMYLFLQIDREKTARHKFKAKFTSNENALCGGDLSDLEGEIVSPDTDEAYVCEWNYATDIKNYNSNYTYGSVLITTQLNSTLVRSRCHFKDPKVTIRSLVSKRGNSVSRTVCGNIETSFRLPATRSVSLKALSKKNDSINFRIKYKAQPCGEVIDVGENPINILKFPNYYNDTLDCVWNIFVPYGNKIQIKMEGSFTYDCDDEYIKISQGFSQFTPEIGTYCKTKFLDSPLVTNFHNIYIEYHSRPQNNSNLKLIAHTDNSQCGGDLSNSKTVFSSPNYPKNYNPNEECTWIITTNLGNSISLSFIDRFVIEYKPNCTKDALIIYDWKNDNYNEIARLCGRHTPISYNSTYNKMKVVFRTDGSTNLEGFKATWTSKCGGKYLASNKEQFLYSPQYPNDYKPMENCVYEITAPIDKRVYVKFIDFNLEGNLPDCEYDNLTVVATSDNKYFQKIYCGNEIPPVVKNFNKVILKFKSDQYLSYKGFVLNYSLYECGGLVTEPTILSPSTEKEYDNNMNCTWTIQAPSNKVIVLKFVYIDVESTDECHADYIAVFDGKLIDDDKRLALLCGRFNSSTVLRSKKNEAIMQFVSDYSYSLTGFKVQVIFTYSESVGCGGHINMAALSDVKTLKSFMLGNNHVYENYLDCTWTITSPPDTIIKIEFTSFHVAPCRNINQTAIGFSKCDCDYVELRDGINMDSLIIGTYCGHNQPPLLSSSNNMMSVRFSTDGEINSSGFEAKLSVHTSLCGKTHFIISDKLETIKSPSLPNGAVPRSLHCVYYLHSNRILSSEIRITIKELDLQPPSGDVLTKCTEDRLAIAGNRNLHNTSLGKDLILHYTPDPFIDNNIFYEELFIPREVEFCGNNKPSDLYFSSNNIAITLVTSPNADSKTYKGVEIEFNYAGLCGRNYTDTQGKIVTYIEDFEENTDIENCFTLITAPENHTISLYFLYVRPNYFSDDWRLQIFDGNDLNSPKLVTMTYEYEDDYPVFFSTGRYMLINLDRGIHVAYDLNFITTDKGRGCGGKLTNELGRVTSPMYPDIYRNVSNCEWELQTPLGTHLKLHFAVFDLGKSCDQNYVQLVNSKGDVISNYCSEKPADYLSTDNYVKIIFHTTQNNGGTGWVAEFIGLL